MIWIDAGHGQDNVTVGKYDPGAFAGQVSEAVVVRGVADFVMLPASTASHAAMGHLPARIAWQRGRVAPKVDLLVSLHMNAGGGTGTECLYATTKPELRPLAAELSRRFSEALGLKDRGAKGDDEGQHSKLGILRVPGVRSLLLEMGFIDNPEDLRKVREGAAKALAEILPTLGGVA